MNERCQSTVANRAARVGRVVGFARPWGGPGGVLRGRWGGRRCGRREHGLTDHAPGRKASPHASGEAPRRGRARLRRSARGAGRRRRGSRGRRREGPCRKPTRRAGIRERSRWSGECAAIRPAGICGAIRPSGICGAIRSLRSARGPRRDAEAGASGRVRDAEPGELGSAGGRSPLPAPCPQPRRPRRPAQGRGRPGGAMRSAAERGGRERPGEV